MRYPLSSLFLLLSTHLALGCCSDQKIPEHTRALYSSAAKDRNDAALSLARCGSRASDAVSRLGQLIYDENVGVQSSAAYALRKIDTKTARMYLKQAEEARARNRTR